MSDLPKSVWAIVDRDEDQLVDEFYKTDRKCAEREARDYDRFHQHFAPHRPVRYDLADPERDRREAEALDHVLTSWTEPDWLAGENDSARKTLEALRDRLKGGAR